MRRELVTIGDLGALNQWSPELVKRMNRHPVMRRQRRVLYGLGAFPGTPSASLQTAAATLYHRLLSGGCTTAPIVECSGFQTEYNAAGGSPRLVIDGKYGPMSEAALDEVLTASADSGGPADGLFGAPASCFGAAPSPAPRPPAPAPSPAPPLPGPRPAPTPVRPAPSTGGGGGLLLAVVAGVGALGYYMYKRTRRSPNPLRRLAYR